MFFNWTVNIPFRKRISIDFHIGFRELDLKLRCLIFLMITSTCNWVNKYHAYFLHMQLHVQCALWLKFNISTFYDILMFYVILKHFICVQLIVDGPCYIIQMDKLKSDDEFRDSIPIPDSWKKDWFNQSCHFFLFTFCSMLPTRHVQFSTIHFQVTYIFISMDLRMFHALTIMYATFKTLLTVRYCSISFSLYKNRYCTCTGPFSECGVW